MTTSKDMITIGGIAKLLNENGSWTGETHLQKTAYIAKTVLDVPLSAEFILYKHGPYSFDLNKNIGHMLARGILSASQIPGYGPSLKVDEPMWIALNDAADNYFARIRDKVEKVCHALARKNVSQLERVSTAIFVMKNFSELNDSERAEKLTKLKPHISVDAANEAIKEANSLF